MNVWLTDELINRILVVMYCKRRRAVQCLCCVLEKLRCNCTVCMCVCVCSHWFDFYCFAALNNNIYCSSCILKTTVLIQCCVCVCVYCSVKLQSFAFQLPPEGHWKKEEEVEGRMRKRGGNNQAKGNGEKNQEFLRPSLETQDSSYVHLVILLWFFLTVKLKILKHFLFSTKVHWTMNQFTALHADGSVNFDNKVWFSLSLLNNRLFSFSHILVIWHVLVLF